MRILRDRWQRTAFARYFADLEPIDRATFWIGFALALAIGISVDVILHSPADVLAPFDIDVAMVRS